MAVGLAVLGGVYTAYIGTYTPPDFYSLLIYVVYIHTDSARPIGISMESLLAM